MQKTRAAVWLDRFVNLALLACAVAIVVVIIRRQRESPSRNRITPVYTSNWKDYTSGREFLGARDAPITIVVFSDFECPFCRELSQSLSSMMREHPGRLSIVHRNFPLSSIHPYAHAAAIAGECAAAQSRFPAMYVQLFAIQDSLGLLKWSDIARRAGVPDTSAFRSCEDDSATIAEVRLDSVAARSLGATVTPTVIVDGWRIDGEPSQSYLEGLISRIMKTK